MPFFKRAKANQAANLPLDGSISSAPTRAAEPDGDGEDAKNKIELSRTKTEDIVYPTGLKLALIMISTFVSMFLVALVSV